MIKYIKNPANNEPEFIRSQQEKQIAQLDQRIENLKFKYSLFFNGEEKLPPEKEREDLQKAIRALSQAENRSPQINMITQNLISKFTLFNNMWLKKMNELESGFTPSSKKQKVEPPPPIEKKVQSKSVQVNLNDEKSFEDFCHAYCELGSKEGLSENEKEKIINTIKSKMIINNVIIGQVEISLSKGKMSLRIKK